MTALDATVETPHPAATAEELAARINSTDFSGCSATIIGYGGMGRQYLKGLQSLGVGDVHVCSRSQAPLDHLAEMVNVTATAGGYPALTEAPSSNDLGIVATPIADLVPAAKHLASIGFRKILIEKPVSLWSVEIDELNTCLAAHGINAFCAYNRLAYPSLIEARARAAQDGRITSCVYSFTEILTDDLEHSHPTDVLARWGVANSLHPIGMAHSVAGLPMTWSGHRSGALAWHPAGSVFVGSGVTEDDIPFSYQADWGSKGRWSVEINTVKASYRLCPLEKLFTKDSSLFDWEEIPIAVHDSQVKAGFAEQLAAMLDPDIAAMVPLMDLTQTARLTAFGEDILGYLAP